jgi:hypothetical protein
MRQVLLWLFIINLGIAFGAGLYESRIVVPQWMPDHGSYWKADAARKADTGLKFWVYVTTVPLTLLSLMNLIAGWKARGPIRNWWLVAALAALLDRVFTFSYFIPTMLRLIDDAMPQSQAVAIAAQWVNLNYARHAILLAAWLAALRTFSLFYARDEQRTGRAG